MSCPSLRSPRPNSARLQRSEGRTSLIVIDDVARKQQLPTALTMTLHGTDTRSTTPLRRYASAPSFRLCTVALCFGGGRRGFIAQDESSMLIPLATLRAQSRLGSVANTPCDGIRRAKSVALPASYAKQYVFMVPASCCGDGRPCDGHFPEALNPDRRASRSAQHKLSPSKPRNVPTARAGQHATILT